MAYAKARANGKFTAVYQTTDGKERSAGTFDSADQAFSVAQAQETHLRHGSQGIDPQTKATMTIGEYWPTWLDQHKVQPSTKVNYEDALRAHILPRFANVRVAELQRSAVRAFLNDMSKAKCGAGLQRTSRSVLSGMMRTAQDDGYRNDNPVLGLRIDKATLPDIIVMTRDQFAVAYDKCPNYPAQLLADTIVSTGLRFGEAAAMLVSDLNFEDSSVGIDVNKALQDVGRKHNPDGKSRFHVGPPKWDSYRVLDVDPDLMERLHEWVQERGAGPEDLLFPRSLVAPAQRAKRQVRVELTPEYIATLGTITAKNGREYQHGTWQAYITAKCRGCLPCRQAFSDYRYELEERKGRRGHSSNAATPSDRFYDESDYLYDDRWNKIWKAACKAAGLDFWTTAYQLRHTHASWAIDDGSTTKDVMERLGHRDLTTTSRYVKKVGKGGATAANMASRRTWGKRAA